MTLPGPRLPGPLTAHLADLCAGLRPRLGSQAATELAEIERRLVEPLRVAVAGRIAAGKSTVVNALVGRRVARTGAGECTRLVTRFHYGPVDRVEVVLRDGRREPLAFDSDGMIPERVGVEVREVSHLEAYLTSAVLRELTVVDTPGLARPAGVPGVGVLDAASMSELATAEAVVYVVTQTVRADDAELLATFGAATGPGPTGPANTLAVLNKVDTVPPESVPGSEGDPARAAELLAAHQAAVLGHRVAGVLPLVGLLAETAETGSFTAADAAALRALAGVDPGRRAAMLASADLFTAVPAPVAPVARSRLLRLLDLHGVARLVAVLAARPELGVGALRRYVAELSGMDALRARLDVVFRSRSDGIKAACALRAVTRLAARCEPAERALVDAGVEAALAHPWAHQLRLLDAVRQVGSRAVPMTVELTAEIVRLGSADHVADQFGLPGAPTSQLVAHALHRARWWRAFATFGATPEQARIAHVVHRAYFLRWQWLGARAEPDG